MGGEGLYLHNCQTNLVIVLHAVSLIILAFHKHNSLPLTGRYGPIKEVHGSPMLSGP